MNIRIHILELSEIYDVLMIIVKDISLINPWQKIGFINC